MCLCILNEDNKKRTTKMPLFPKNVVHFGLFTNGIWEYFSNKVIVLNATSVLMFQYKNAKKTSFNKYYTTDLFQLL